MCRSLFRAVENVCVTVSSKASTASFVSSVAIPAVVGTGRVVIGSSHASSASSPDAKTSLPTSQSSAGDSGPAAESSSGSDSSDSSASCPCCEAEHEATPPPPAKTFVSPRGHLLDEEKRYYNATRHGISRVDVLAERARLAEQRAQLAEAEARLANDKARFAELQLAEKRNKKDEQAAANDDKRTNNDNEKTRYAKLDFYKNLFLGSLGTLFMSYEAMQYTKRAELSKRTEGAVSHVRNRFHHLIKSINNWNRHAKKFSKLEAELAQLIKEKQQPNSKQAAQLREKERMIKEIKVLAEELFFETKDCVHGWGKHYIPKLYKLIMEGQLDKCIPIVKRYKTEAEDKITKDNKDKREEESEFYMKEENFDLYQENKRNAIEAVNKRWGVKTCSDTSCVDDESESSTYYKRYLHS